MDFEAKLGTLLEEGGSAWDFSGCHILPEGAMMLAKCLSQDCQAVHLDVTRSHLGAEGAKALARSLANNATVQRWDLRDNGIGVEGAAAVGACLERNSALQRLDISYNQLTYAGAAALATCLQKNSTLQHLDLSGNSIGDEGAVSVARSLRSHSSLQHLDLSRNRISDAGVAALAHCLLQNTILRELDLRVNSFGHDGAQSLLSSLQHNTTLFALHVSDNDIPDAVWASIDELLCRNQRLGGIRCEKGTPEANQTDSAPPSSELQVESAKHPSVVAEAMRLLMVQVVNLEEANGALQSELNELRQQNLALQAMVSVQEECAHVLKQAEVLPVARVPEASLRDEAGCQAIRALVVEVARLNLELVKGEAQRQRRLPCADAIWLATAVLVGWAAGAMLFRDWPRAGS